MQSHREPTTYTPYRLGGKADPTVRTDASAKCVARFYFCSFI